MDRAGVKARLAERKERINAVVARRRAHARDVMGRLLRRKLSRPMRVAAIAAAILLVAGFAPFTFGKMRTQIAEAGSGPIVQEAMVKSLKATSIGSKFDGTIKQIHVRPGQEVKKGDVLLTMNGTPVEARYRSARESLTAEEQSLNELRSQLAAEMKGFDAQIAELNQAMAAERALATSEARDEAGSLDFFTQESDADAVSYDNEMMQERLTQITQQIQELRAARHERAQSYGPSVEFQEGRARAAREQVEYWGDLLKHVTRRAPFDGVITAVDVGAHSPVRAGQAIVRLDDPRSYRVVTKVPLKIRERLSTGQDLAVLTGETEQRSAAVTLIQDGWERDVLNYWVYLNPADKSGLAPGQKVRVKLPAKTQVAVEPE